MGNISLAYNFVLAKCNAPNVGYSQAYRQGQTVDGIQYYDCSSLMSEALTVGGYFETNPWFYTAIQRDVLKNAGFIQYNPNTQPWAKGDIMWREGHTEMVYDPANYITMGAHSANRPLADQVSISSSSSKGKWTYGFHAPDSFVTDPHWHAKRTGAYAKESVEAYENAVTIYGILFNKGWTLNAVCGLLGNFEAESGYNPWRWQSDNVQSSTASWVGGYGLFQFTPASKYINDALARTYEGFGPNFSNQTGNINDGNAQVLRVDASTDWYVKHNNYPYTFAEYKALDISPADCASAWYYNFEMPPSTDTSEPLRRSTAMYWYETLSGVKPPQPEPFTRRHKMPVWMMIRPRRRF